MKWEEWTDQPYAGGMKANAWNDLNVNQNTKDSDVWDPWKDAVLVAPTQTAIILNPDTPSVGAAKWNEIANGRTGRASRTLRIRVTVEKTPDCPCSVTSMSRTWEQVLVAHVGSRNYNGATGPYFSPRWNESHFKQIASESKP
jgi:hypothetical protein